MLHKYYYTSNIAYVSVQNTIFVILYMHYAWLIVHNSPYSRWGVCLCMARGRGEWNPRPPFILPHFIQEASKCTYVISTTFPTTSQNPHDRIYKTPSVGDLQSWPSPKNVLFLEIYPCSTRKMNFVVLLLQGNFWPMKLSNSPKKH